MCQPTTVNTNTPAAMVQQMLPYQQSTPCCPSTTLLAQQPQQHDMHTAEKPPEASTGLTCQRKEGRND
eukprot:scaffold187813_cov80-Cyclotella_meneghiniana.AAC.1